MRGKINYYVVLLISCFYHIHAHAHQYQKGSAEVHAIVFQAGEEGFEEQINRYEELQ
jgi:hypothetical protein